MKFFNLIFNNLTKTDEKSCQKIWKLRKQVVYLHY
nr:MAG TPA: nucleophosmin protein [Caudoviricetes sp.]DAN46756.1 MAG TPA: nucleophosmin protein [Caudoviricetes sp.]